VSVEVGLHMLGLERISGDEKTMLSASVFAVTTATIYLVLPRKANVKNS
jgi:hypothetical protein